LRVESYGWERSLHTWDNNITNITHVNIKISLTWEHYTAQTYTISLIIQILKTNTMKNPLELRFKAHEI